MAEFVSNRVVCSRKVAEKLIRRDASTNYLDQIDFNKVIPMPKELRMESSSRIPGLVLSYLKKLKIENASEFEVLYQRFKEKSSLEKEIDFDAVTLLNDKDCELGQRYLHNLFTYGHYAWYTWSIANWGVKWNALPDSTIINEEEDHFELIFSTAWDPPYGVVYALCSSGETDFRWFFTSYDHGDYEIIWEDSHLKIVRLAEAALENVDLNSEYEIIKEIRNRFQFYFELPKEKQNNKRILLEALDLSTYRFCDYDAWIQRLDPSLLHDLDVAMAFISKRDQLRAYFDPKLFQSRESILKQVALHGQSLKNLSTTDQDDEEIVSTAIEEDGSAIQYASNRLKMKKDLALKAIRQNYVAFEYLPLSMQKQDDILETYLYSHPCEFYTKMPVLITDKEKAYHYIDIWGLALAFVSEELRDDMDLVKLAIAKDGYNLIYASERLKNNKDLMKEAVKKDSDVLYEFYANHPIQDRDFLKEMVEVDSSALKYASQELKDDKEIALFALKKDGNAFAWISHRLQADPDIWEVLRNSVDLNLSYQSLSKELLANKDFLISLHQVNLLPYIPNTLKNDADFMSQMISIDVEAIQYAGNKLLHKPEFLLGELQKNIRILNYLHFSVKNDMAYLKPILAKLAEHYHYRLENSDDLGRFVLRFLADDECTYLLEFYPELCENQSFMEQAVRANYHTLKYASPELKNDEDVVLPAIMVGLNRNRDSSTLTYASEELQRDREFIWKLLYQNPIIFKFMKEELKKDEDILLYVGTKEPYLLRYASSNLFDSKEFAMKLIPKNPHFFFYISDRLKEEEDILRLAIKKKVFLDLENSKMKKNRNLILLALKKRIVNFSDLDEEMKTDEEIINLYLDHAEYIDEEAIRYFRLNDKKEALQRLSKNGQMIKLCSKDLQDDEEVARVAVSHWGEAIQYVSDRLKNNKELVLLAIENDTTAYRFVGEEVKKDVDVIKRVLSLNSRMGKEIAKNNENQDTIQKMVQRSAMMEICYNFILNSNIFGNYSTDETESFFKGCYTKQEHYDRIIQTISEPQNADERFLLVCVYDDYGAVYRQKAIQAILDYLNDAPSSKGIFLDNDGKVFSKKKKEYLLSVKHHQGIWLRRLGQLYVQEKKMMEAMQAFDECINLDPYYHGSYIDKALFLEKFNETGYHYLQMVKDSDLYTRFPRNIPYEKGADFRKKIDRQLRILKNKKR